MKNLALSLAIVSVFVILTFSALSLLHVPQEIAGSAAGIFLGAMPYVHKVVERRSKRPLPVLARDQVVSLESFAMPHAILFFYATLVGLAATQGVGVLGGFIAAITSGGNDLPFQAAAGLLLLLQFPLAYLVGKWIGIRSGPRGILVLMLVFAVVVSAEHSFRLLWASDEEFQELFGEARTAELILLQWGAGLVIWSSIGLLGFWRGRRVRLARYADYLLKKLPAETRNTVLLLLRDEVAALASKEDGKADQKPAGLKAPTPQLTH